MNKEFKKTTTVIATGKSLNKRFNNQNNGCARALEIFVNFFAFFAMKFELSRVRERRHLIL